MKQQTTICFLLLIALAASRSIQESYSLSAGQYTSDFALKYSSPNLGEYGFLSEAGDINNDGLTDFMVADPKYDNNKGIVYVIYGKKGSLRRMDTLNDFTSADGFIIKGNSIEQKLGFAVNSAGDVNGDGIDDFIIGSYNWRQDSYTLQVGVTYVVFGRRSSSEFPFQLDVDRLSSTQGFRMFGEAAKHISGCSVSGAGDVNGDGLADVLVAAVGWGPKGDSGKVYIVYGRRSGWEDIKFPPAYGRGVTFEGQVGEHLGNSISKIGDFNGDGLDDIIIGAHTGESGAGRAYIFFGRPDFPSVVASNSGMTLSGARSGDNFGCTVTNLGDFNGDGLMDVAVGAYSANSDKGLAYVIMGSTYNPSSISMSSLSSSRGFSLSSSRASSGSQVGLFVTGGRDYNGDGMSDLVFSAPGLNSNKGAVFVVYGSSKFSYSNVVVENLFSNEGFTMNGPDYGDRFGYFVRTLKDVNKDGVPDLLIGANGSNGGKGIVYLVYQAWKCSSNCDSCSKPDTCDTCSPGYGFLYGDCSYCPSTHTLSNGNCVAKCPSNCQSCSSSGVCNACVSGYGFLNGNCVSCPSTHILSNGNCIVNCPSTCQSCSSSGVCNACVYGYGFLNGACVVCPSNTHTLSNGNCVVKCSANCQSCSQPNTCDVCSSGYGFLNGACVVCPADTHVLSSGSCKTKCSANCQSCSQPNTCDVCSSGYGFLDGKCVSCPSTHTLSNGYCKPKCSANCQSCSQPNTCDTCVQGYGFLNGDCVVCPSTHTLDNGLCKAKCAANCEQCSDSNKCDVCNQGYGFLDGKCVTCPASTHVLSNGYCFIKCSENCSKCSEPNKCDVCLSGFGFLDDEECSLCPATTHFLNNGYCIEFQDKFKIIKDFFSGLFGR